MTQVHCKGYLDLFRLLETMGSETDRLAKLQKALEIAEKAGNMFMAANIRKEIEATRRNLVD